jgi:hypothetical protein
MGLMNRSTMMKHEWSKASERGVHEEDNLHAECGCIWIGYSHCDTDRLLRSQGRKIVADSNNGICSYVVFAVGD